MIGVAPYLGDFLADQAVYFIWDTSATTGASVTRTVDGTISVYKDNSDGSSYNQTQVTTGVTNDEDVDSLTGVHSCCITTTNAWYETGHDYNVVLSAATIDGQTVNAVLAHFSIENRSTVADIKAIDVLTESGGSGDLTAIKNAVEATNATARSGGSGDLTAIKTQVDAILDLERDSGVLAAGAAEQSLFEDAAPGKNKFGVVVKIDLTLLAAGDTYIIREKYKDESGGSYQTIDEITYTGAQSNPLRIINLTPYRYGAVITAQKTAGTDRNIEWESFVGE